MTKQKRNSILLAIFISLVVVLFLLLDAYGASSRHVMSGEDVYIRSADAPLDVWYPGLDSIKVVWVKSFDVRTAYHYDPITLKLSRIEVDTLNVTFDADTTFYD